MVLKREKRKRGEGPESEKATTPPRDWASTWHEMYPNENAIKERQCQKRSMVINNAEWEVSIPEKRSTHKAGGHGQIEEEKEN